MNSIAQNDENSKYISKRIRNFFRVCGLTEALQKSNCCKEKGVAVTAIIGYLFCLVFRNRSAYADILLGGTDLKKDTIYRLLNSVRTNWMKFTTLLAAKLIREKLEPLTSEKRRKVFVIDDTIYERERSTKVEPLSWVYDHAKRHKCVKGFRMLSLGWSDGVTFMPINNKRSEYLVLLTTDTSLTEDEVIQLYCRRWEIEVFFKTCKSTLWLTRGCRSVSYDAICAHTAIVFARYMFLAMETRITQDERTVGPLFCIIPKEIAEISVTAAFEKIQLFLQKLLRGFNSSEEEICAVFTALLVEIPACIADILAKSRVEAAFDEKSVCEV